MSTAKFPLLEADDVGTVHPRGAVHYKDGGVQYVPPKDLDDDRKATLRRTFRTAQATVDEAQRYYAPNLKRVRPWKSFYGTLEALRECLAVVGWELDGDAIEASDDAYRSGDDDEPAPAEATKGEWAEDYQDLAREEYWEGAEE